jgi:hypothetical protein
VTLIDELVREGARRMQAEALQAEVDDYLARHPHERDQRGRRLVVPNGHHQSREVLTAAGAGRVVPPRVRDRQVGPDTGERMRFSSASLPSWCRKSSSSLPRTAGVRSTAHTWSRSCGPAPPSSTASSSDDDVHHEPQAT